MINVSDKVARKGSFDGNVGIVKDLTYIKGMAIVRFAGGECCVDIDDLVLYSE